MATAAAIIARGVIASRPAAASYRAGMLYQSTDESPNRVYRCNGTGWDTYVSDGAAGATGATGSTGATGATGPAGSAGATGAAGSNGTNGSVWYHGSGAPGSGTGVNGDYYLNTANGDVYTKAAGSWGSPIENLTGPTGAAGSGTGDMLGANNLSDLANKATARTTLGVAIGTDVQAHDADLDTIAGLTATTDSFMQAKSSAWAARTPTQVTADLTAVVGDSGSGGTKGLVPAPGAGDAAAGKFLKADGTFAVPSGGGVTTAEYVTTASDGGLSAEVAIPGLAGSADRAGVGGANLALEFDTGTEGVTWVPSNPTTHDSDTTIPSHLYAAETDGTTRHAKVAYAPAGTFDLRAKMSFGFDGGGANTGSGGGLAVLDGSDNNIALLQVSVTKEGQTTLGCYSGSGFTATVGAANIGNLNRLYLRIKRVSTSTYTCYWSTDGLLWVRYGSFTSATAVASAALRLFGGTGTAEIACDWLRATG